MSICLAHARPWVLSPELQIKIFIHISLRDINTKVLYNTYASQTSQEIIINHPPDLFLRSILLTLNKSSCVLLCSKAKNSVRILATTVGKVLVSECDRTGKEAWG